MIRLLPIVALLLVLPGLLAGCDSYQDDIDKVQAATSAGQTNEQLVKDLAGARGTFKWSAGETEKYGKDTGIVQVEARIERSSRAGADQVVQLRWLHNRETGVIDYEEVLINGRSRGILGATLDLLMLELE